MYWSYTDRGGEGEFRSPSVVDDWGSDARCCQHVYRTCVVSQWQWIKRGDEPRREPLTTKMLDKVFCCYFICIVQKGWYFALRTDSKNYAIVVRLFFWDQCCECRPFLNSIWRVSQLLKANNTCQMSFLWRKQWNSYPQVIPASWQQVENLWLGKLNADWMLTSSPTTSTD